MYFAETHWTDQTDFRPLPYQPPKPSAMKLSLVAGAIMLGLGLPIILGSLSRVSDIDPRAVAGRVVHTAMAPDSAGDVRVLSSPP